MNFTLSIISSNEEASDLAFDCISKLAKQKFGINLIDGRKPDEPIIHEDLLEQLRKNYLDFEHGKRLNDCHNTDIPPVVRVCGDNYCALFTEFDPRTRTLYGLQDMGVGSPEIGSVLLDELIDISKTIQLRSDQDFLTDKPLRQYAEEAAKVGKIVFSRQTQFKF